MRHVMIVFTLLCPGSAYGQDGERQLSAVFTDHFTGDTRQNYAVSGNVSWKSSRLTLASGSTLTRRITGSDWVKLAVTLVKPEAGREAPREWQVWFDLDGATSCYLRLRRAPSTNRTEVALVDTGQPAGTTSEETVREAIVDNARGAVAVEYRHGVVDLFLGQRRVFAGYVSNGSAPVIAVRIHAVQDATELANLALHAGPAVDPVLTSDERRQLADAQAGNNELIRLYREGSYAEAARVGQRVCEIRETVLGDDHPQYASSLNNLSVMHRTMGDFRRAEELLSRASAIWKSALGDRHPEYASSLNNLGVLFQQTGEYGRAEPVYRQAIAIEAEVLGKQHPRYATSVNNLALLSMLMGDYPQAAALYDESIRIQELINHPDYSTTLNNLAALYLRMGDYRRAEPLYRKAIELLKSSLGEQHTEYAVSLNNLARLYRETGDYASAETLQRQVTNIWKAALGPNHPNYATSLNNLADLREARGDLDEAERLYRKAATIRRETLGAEHPNYASSLNTLGVLYMTIGQLGRAAEVFGEAIAIRKSVLGEHHPDHATTVNNLGLLSLKTGDYATAETSLEQSAKIRKTALGDDHPDYAATLRHQAALYLCLDSRARAESSAREAAAIMRRHLDNNSVVQSERQQRRNQSAARGYLDWRLSTGLDLEVPAEELLLTVWRWKGAVTLRQRAYRTAATNPQLSAHFSSLQAVSRRLSAHTATLPLSPADDTDSARNALYRQRRAKWDAEFASLAQQRESLEHRIATRSEAFRTLTSEPSISKLRERLPARAAFLDFLEYQHSSATTGEDPPLTHTPRYLAFVVRPDRETAVVTIDATMTKTAVDTFWSSLAHDDSSRDQTSKASRTLRQELWLPLEKHLDGIETIIISPDTELGKLPWAALPDHGEGRYLLERYRFVSMPLAAMLQSVSAPQRSSPPEDSRLLLVGDVNYDADLSVSPSTPPASVSRAAPRSREMRWQSLPGFQQELAIIRDHFETRFGTGVTILRRSEATESAFMREAPRHSILHLVTHGFFADPEFGAMTSVGPASAVSSWRAQLRNAPAVTQYVPGLLSGVVLAGANTASRDGADTDGILTAAEIETLDLSNVDLAVLSACETGLGTNAGGEGLTGLQRGFHVAGAHSVIATLWEVDDKATQELMSRFYRNYLHGGQSKIDALRNAQLEILRDRRLARGLPRRRNTVATPGTTDEDRTDPRHWAAFVLSGDWR